MDATGDSEVAGLIFFKHSGGTVRLPELGACYPLPMCPWHSVWNFFQPAFLVWALLDRGMTGSKRRPGKEQDTVLMTDLLKTDKSGF